MEGLLRFAEAHHGLVSGLMASEVGVTADRIHGLVRRGRLGRGGPGVVRIRGAVPTWEQGELRAVWAAGPAAVAGSEAAARLWRLPGFDRAEVVVLRRGHSRRIRTGITETVFLPPRHIGVINAIPVTTAE